jgi:hypothetical protein
MLMVFSTGSLSAAVTNDECMGCHGEKGLTTPGPGKTERSLYTDIKTFQGSVHSGVACVQCHPVSEVPHPEKIKSVGCVSCHGDVSKSYRPSIHAAGRNKNASCGDCHGHHDVQDPKRLTSAACSTCHDKPYAAFRKGMHARVDKKGKEAASCMECHGSHGILKGGDPASPVSVANLAKTCARCHANPEARQGNGFSGVDDVYALYMDSIHGRSAGKAGASATCSDCHGTHEILSRNDKTSAAYPTNIPATCGKCHQDEEKRFNVSIHAERLHKGNTEAPSCASCHPPHHVQSVNATAFQLDVMRECGTCHDTLLETYRHTFHGKVTNLGFARSAKCADCHRAHEVLPQGDVRSSISKEHLLETCRACHPNADARFTEFRVHADYRDKERYPFLYYTWLFMTILLVSVFGFFGIHTILWLPRSWIERVRQWRKGAQK